MNIVSSKEYEIGILKDTNNAKAIDDFFKTVAENKSNTEKRNQQAIKLSNNDMTLEVIMIEFLTDLVNNVKEALRKKEEQEMPQNALENSIKLNEMLTKEILSANVVEYAKKNQLGGNELEKLKQELDNESDFIINIIEDKMLDKNTNSFKTFFDLKDEELNARDLLKSIKTDNAKYSSEHTINFVNQTKQ